MKKKILLTSIFSVLLASAIAIPCVVTSQKSKVDPDDLTYKDDEPVSIMEPKFASDDEEEEEGVTLPDKVVLHYVNEENDCKSRAFYLWVTGVDGVEYSDVNASDIVTYADDGSAMAITIDIKNDTRFQAFAGKPNLMYIIKFKKISDSNLNWGGQSDDVELKYSEFVPVSGVSEVWSTPAAGGGIAQFNTEAETKVDGIKKAEFTSWKAIKCTTTDLCVGQSVSWSLYAYDETFYKVKAKNREAIKKNYIVKEGTQAIDSTKTFNINFKYNAHINIVYVLVSKLTTSTSPLTKTAYVSFTNLYLDARFEQYYTYKDMTEDNELGMTYWADGNGVQYARLKVWAPTAANMSLLLYESGTPVAYDPLGLNGGSDKYKGYHMTYSPKGIWTITMTSDPAKGDKPLLGKYYCVQVDNTSGTNVTVDPYATACGVCGVRGLIYDKAATNPTGWTTGSTFSSTLDPISSPQDLSIYEVHVADLTGDSSWVSNKGNENGTYNAFVESGTTYTDTSMSKTVSTGYDHIKDLGVNAVQLMPVFDADNDESVAKIKYNWGYNPQNYNCVEGAYSSNPFDGAVRIKEFKNLILEMSKKRLGKDDVSTRVIMDVVYNHVSSASASSFNKIMPRYYFRYDANGELTDGSGCHNEFRTESSMGRKFIVDSLYMWATEYNIKGFRFDLMGLIDTETLRVAKKVLYDVDPSIYIYGEGWSAGGFGGGLDVENNKQSIGTTSDKVYSELWQSDNEIYLGGFNDNGRNAVKGANSAWGSDHAYPQKGYLQFENEDGNFGGVENMLKGIYGDAGANPKQCVNYVSCHDNWTLVDHFYNTFQDGRAMTIEECARGVTTAHAMVFASNGVAFMLGGEEILRTKDLSFVTDAEEYEKILPNTYEWLHSRQVSHNSYNSPIEVNSFKWGNKCKVQFPGCSDPAYQMTGDKDVFKAFQDMIKMHRNMPRRDLNNTNQISTFKASYGDSKFQNAGGIGMVNGNWTIFFASKYNCEFKEDVDPSSYTAKTKASFGVVATDSSGYKVQLGNQVNEGLGFSYVAYNFGA